MLATDGCGILAELKKCPAWSVIEFDSIFSRMGSESLLDF